MNEYGFFSFLLYVENENDVSSKMKQKKNKYKLGGVIFIHLPPDYDFDTINVVIEEAI